MQKGISMARPLSPSAISALRAGRLSDPATVGLTIEAKASGRKVWRYDRRVAGRIHKATLGTFPAFTIVDAREWANDLNTKIERGIDPVEEKREEAKLSITMDEAHERYMAACKTGMHRLRQRKLSANTIKEKAKIWKDVSPILGKRVLSSVTALELWNLVIEKGDPDEGDSPVRANRMAAELKVFFKFCCMPIGTNPIGLAADPSSTLNGGYFEEAERQRFFSADEIGWFLRAIAMEKPIRRRYFSLLLLTGCRLHEGTGAHRREFDADGWEIAGERSKNREPLMLPLGPWGRSIFAGTNSDWIFQSPVLDDKPQLNSWNEACDAVIARMEEFAGRKIEKWRCHDIRRTVRTNLERLKVSEAVSEAILHHKKTGLNKTYNRHDYYEEKRDALLLWENYLREIAERHGITEALYIPN